jgi:[ribosomal protein S5]-alanine N-acetyltransferase
MGGTPSLAERVQGLALPIRTRRLELVLPRFDQVEALVALLSEPSVARWTLHIPHPYRASDARKDILRSRTWRRTGRALPLLIVRRADGDLIGGVGLYQLNENHASAEVGYWVGRPYRRRGYAEEATRGLVNAAFRHLGLHRVEAAVFLGNEASVRLLRRCGFRYEGRVRDEVRKDGVWRSTLWFARLSTDPVRTRRASRTA